MECLVGPFREDNMVLHDHYLRALDNFEYLVIGEEEFMRAAQLWAKPGLRTPDALHLAVAQRNGGDALWTNDKRLASAAHGHDLDVIGTENRQSD